MASPSGFEGIWLMPSRVMRGEFISSESMSDRSRDAALLFVHLVLSVDDYGRLDGRPRALRSLLFPMRNDVSVDDIYSWLGELAGGDDPPIRIYHIDDKPYIHLVNWEKHRGKSRRGGKSRWPAPPDSTESFPGDPRGSAEPHGDQRGSTGIPGDPKGSARGVGESGKRGVGEARKECGADAPPATPDVLGFVRMLKGQIPVGLGGETWDSPREWLEAHAPLITAEAQLEAECDSGPQFNRAFKAKMLRFWNSKSPPGRSAGQSGSGQRQGESHSDFFDRLNQESRDAERER